MSYAMIAGTVISAATTAYSVNQQKKAQKKAQQAAGQLPASAPQAAEYKPVELNQEQINAITANRDALPYIRQLMSRSNNFLTADALRRARKLIPNYDLSMRNLGAAAGALTGGQLPLDELEKIIGSRAENSSGINIPGLAGPATLKDLGLSSLDAINQGSGLLGKMVSMAETISPRGGYMKPQDMMLSPQERIRLEMEQRGLVQQSDQNAYNLEATASPQAMANLRMASGEGANAASMAAQLGQMANSAVGSVNQWGTNTGRWGAHTGFDATTGMYRNLGAANAVYNTAPGYTPVYGTQGGQIYFQYYKPVAA